MSASRIETTADAGPGSRFDPFLLPTATAVRFALLIMTAAVGSMYLGVWYAALGGAMGLDTVHGGALSACASQVRADAARLPDLAVFNVFADCVTVERRTLLLWMIGLGPVWACLALLVYAIYPRLLQRRLRPLRHAEGSGGVRAARVEVDAVLGDTRGRVELLTTPGTAGGARAFGAFGKYRIAVDSSLLVLRKDGSLDERALAVIRHETAHLRNRDVDLTYAAMSSWWAFLMLTGVPLLVYMFVALVSLATGPWNDSLNDAMATLAVSVFVLLLLQSARARVLRTREHYADVRAARVGRTREELHSLLSPRPSPPSPRRQRWWRGHAVYHPSHQARLDMLDAPWRLVEPSGVDLAIVGIALGAAHLHLYNTYTLTAPESVSSTGTNAVFVALAAPVGALIAAMVWNAVHAAPEAAHRWRAKAAALSGGILLGLSLPNPFTNMWSELLPTHFARAALSVLVLWGMCLSFLKWATVSARAWLATAGRKRAVCFAGLVCGAAVFGCLFALWDRFHGKVADGTADGWVAVWNALTTTGTAWALPAAIGCATVFTFTGLLRRPPAPRPALRPLGPIVAGCAVAAGHGGLLAGAMILAMRQRRTPTDAWVDAVLLLTLLLAAVVSVGLGVRSGGRGRHGVALCVSAVFVLVVLALQPAVFWVTIQSVTCLNAPSPGCWGLVVNGLPTSYANALMIFVGLAVFLVVCGMGAVAGSWIRAKVRPDAPTEGRYGAALPRGGRRAVGTLAAIAAAAIVLGTSLYANFTTAEQRIDQAQRSRLQPHVEPATVSREAACDAVSRGLAPSVESSSGGVVSYGYEAEIVALSSSTDPVLSAFGRAALDGATAADSRLFNMAILYCRTDASSQR
ncbi:M48 family metalloprotease [Streptomyces purpurogeneiscleroticus]|uniref:M48 family metalloprotease n=1 Tax=Streptomyces purpurogeneiscleroticus TaxID=68259 RepID=UPI001CBFF633|nr:M48 family metalloprotease [Streptomyces purpurogeneiscleroticus]MBZ4017603.1 hypothetical protein [Streptomyces purpurogeneiscleroticus]